MNPAMAHANFGQGEGIGIHNSQFAQHGAYQPPSHSMQQSGYQTFPTLISHGSDNPSSRQVDFAGQKRKREFPRGSQRGPNMPKIPVGPAVPGFGAPASLPAKPTFLHNGAVSEDVRIQPTVNQLGLTPSSMQQDPEESEDDANEEEVGEELLLADSAGKLMFEHNGAVSTLNTPAEIKAWIEERRKQWPTRQRMIEKSEEARKRGEERKRIQAEAAALRKPVNDQRAQYLKRGKCEPNSDQKDDDGPNGSKKRRRKGKEDSKVNSAETELDSTKKSLAEQMKKVEELEAQIAKKEARARHQTSRNSEAGRNGNLQSNTEVNSRIDGQMEVSVDPKVPNVRPDQVSLQVQYTPSILAHSWLVPTTDVKDLSRYHAILQDDSSSVSSDSSSNISSDSDSDGPPEETTSKPAPGSVPQQRLCSTYVNNGFCKFGERCRYRHELPQRGAAAIPAPPKPEVSRRKEKPMSDTNDRVKPKSLFQRLVEQEQESDHRLALQAIKHLGAVGFFRQQVAEPEQVDATPAEELAVQMNLSLDPEQQTTMPAEQTANSSQVPLDIEKYNDASGRDTESEIPMPVKVESLARPSAGSSYTAKDVPKKQLVSELYSDED